MKLRLPKLSTLVISAILFSILSLGCPSNSRKKEGSLLPAKKSGEKYAVVCTGASIRDRAEGLHDPIDKNCFWVSTFRVYNELLKRGYKPENVYVLYKDGKPPFDDKEHRKKIKKIKREFNGSYPNIATSSRLGVLLNGLEGKIKPEDEFTLYLNMHGCSWGRVYFEHDDSSLSGSQLNDILEGNQSRNILIFGGSCYAEAFTNNIDHKSILIAGAKRDRIGWLDRNFSCGSWFFAEMNNRDNDFNKDGQVSPYEAFIRTRKRCMTYRKKIDWFLRNEYKDPSPLSEWDLKKMDFIPVYRESSP